MVLHIVKWDINSDKLEAYLKWSPESIKRQLAVPGLVEFRAYRAESASSQVMVTYEFADLAAWAAFHSHPDIQKATSELYSFASNVTSEIWGPSPVAPAPIRPGK